LKRDTSATLENDVGIEHYLSRQKRIIDKYLDDFLPAADTSPKILHEAMRYSVFAGGKRIRSILVLATGEALGGEFDELIHLACAIEMIHSYSLIHDDLPAMDNDDYRRGQLTAHKKFGEGIAILAGNALLTLALQLLAETPSASAETKVAVIDRICRAVGTAGGMLAGQAMDLETQGKRFSRDQLEKIHASKTGALIQASIHGTALLLGTPEQVHFRLSSFGSRLGLAYQIVDDILDVRGSSKELGKTSGKDGLDRKATYPALYGLETSQGIATELVESAIRKISFLGAEGKKLRELARFISVRRF
jgi:geranylgeranyl diphosphate synthase, type II